MTAVVALNGADVLGLRLTIPATGPWLAEVEVEGDAPAGRAVLTVGAEALVGTVDPRGTGRMGERVTVSLVGGGGGWDKRVPAQHLHNDFGVTSTAVYTVTAAAVGETVVDPAPRVLGADYVRSDGPASRVLRGAAWYVDAAGVTQIGTRPGRAMGDGIRILEWDALTRRAVLAADAIVWPGTLLVDPRFTSATVREVEQNWTADGARVLAWCETGSTPGDELAGNRLARSLGLLAREAVGVAYLREYPYRVVEQGVDGRLTLQAVSKTDGVPELLRAVTVWPGVAGVSHEYAPASVVLVGFVAGDPTKPAVVGFAEAGPEPAVTTIAAGRVDIGAGTKAGLLADTSLLTWIGQITGYVNGLAPGTATPPSGYVAGKFFAE